MKGGWSSGETDPVIMVSEQGQGQAGIVTQYGKSVVLYCRCNVKKQVPNASNDFQASKQILKRFSANSW